MTALITSIVAIVLFGMMLVATVSYGDVLGFMSTTDSAQLVARLEGGVALVSQIQHDTGTRPTTVSQLMAAGMPPQIAQDGSSFDMRCGDERCSPMDLCLVLPSTPANVTAATSAAARLKGFSSGQCGSSAAAVSDTVVIDVSI